MAHLTTLSLSLTLIWSTWLHCDGEPMAGQHSILPRQLKHNFTGSGRIEGLVGAGRNEIFSHAHDSCRFLRLRFMGRDENRRLGSL